MTGKIYIKSSEKMSEVSDESIDLVITHPPYLGSNWKAHEAVYHPVFSEIDRVIKKDAVVVIVNTDIKKKGIYAKHIDIYNWFVGYKKYRLLDHKIWLRSRKDSLTRKSYSHIQFFTKGNPKLNTKSPHLSNYLENVWFIPDSMMRTWFKDAFHPQIPKIIISVFSNPSDLVLDPFAGVGTTLHEAIRLKRNAIGYDIDKELIPLIQTYAPGIDIVR